MAEAKAPVLVVVQLTGGNDYLNTVIPYTDANYRDYRPSIGIPENDILRLDDEMGLHPSMGPTKELYEKGEVAVIHGVGYANSSRSHFRSMDIWHTCEPEKVGTEGWLGRVIRELDPKQENPVTGVNFGYDLPRAMAAPGVPVACVVDLATYGLLPGVTEPAQRAIVLDRFKRLYSPAIGTGPAMNYLAQTALQGMDGADILKVAPQRYSSTVEYANNPVAQKLKGIAQVHLAELGTRVFYCDYSGFDTHAGQVVVHATLWRDVSRAIADFFDDLKEHDAADNVMMLVFSEFGRRVRDNGSGTDHGSAGVSFVIGPQVKGGMHGIYPSTNPDSLEQGDLVATLDFRGMYSTLIEKWLKLDSKPIVEGTFEQPSFVRS